MSDINDFRERLRILKAKCKEVNEKLASIARREKMENENFEFISISPESMFSIKIEGNTCEIEIDYNKENISRYLNAVL